MDNNNKSYLNRQITFTIFNRKDMPKNKKVDLLKKYRSMDAFDQDRNFWNLMSAPVQGDRGFYSRKVPITPMVYKHDKDEDLAYFGDLKRHALNDVLDEVRTLTTDVCVQNGFIDLRKIEWNDGYQQEEIQEVSGKQKYKPIETSDSHKSKNDLTVKK